VAAYAVCERIAKAHYENFPVASRLLPARMRPHVAAIYAFARTADDFADEGDLSAAERLDRLNGWHARLRASAPDASDPVFAALRHTIETCRLPVGLFEDLLSAFRQDVTTRRYATWDELLDYCRRSANPVGRLVLRIAGYDDPALDRASDALCTALQLTNFWQDLAVDWRRGRLYVPLTDIGQYGAREEDLTTGRMTPAWKGVLRDVAVRTSAWFDQGRSVCRVRGRLGWELRFTWLGGRRILDRLGRDGFDPFDRRPTLGAGDVPLLVWRALTWPRV
jgi:phytoene synthase